MGKKAQAGSSEMIRKSVLIILCVVLLIGANLFLAEKNEQVPRENIQETAEKIKEPAAGPPANNQAAAANSNEIAVENLETGRLPVVKYIIDAHLFPDKRTLKGTEILTWINKSTQRVDNLRFHLYYNGFKNPQTTFFQESKIYRESQKELSKLKFGGITIEKIRVIGGADSTAKMRFLSPDDGNPNDRTVMHLDLEKPVQHNQAISIKIDFALEIPGIFSRTGAVDDYFFMGQWFPKIGVLQEDGAWNCHQLHNYSEFFADYGDYKVSLTVPGKFVVGATGNLIKNEKNRDGTITYFYEETNIHDFAWTAYPHFKKYVKQIKLPGNATETTVELLLSPHHGEAKERYLNSLEFALDFYAENIFPYPYKKITLVDPPLKGFRSGGMEYPTLITLGYIGYLPQSLNPAEKITVHEVGHQYWYGIVGSDEAGEAWLDEGITTFFEMEILDEYFTPGPSFLDLGIIHISAWEYRRANYLSLLPVDKIGQASGDFMNLSQYANNVYAKAGLLLRSLKNYVGKQKMYDFFKYYAGKYKYKHANGEDFIAAFNEFMNEDFSWAFDRFIKDNKGVDHAVYSVESTPIASQPGMYRSEVIFLRKEGYFPVELLIKLKNGRSIKAFWQEEKKWRRIVTINESPVDYAVIDPEYKIVLDRNFLDNSKMREPRRSGIKKLALKFGFFFQAVLSFLAW